MKPSYVWAAILLIILATVVYLTISGGPSPEVYASAIEADRQKKDDYMRNDDRSPLYAKRDSFPGLKYFPPDLSFTFLARLEPVTNKQVRVLQTSTGEQARYLDYAWAVFEKEGKEYRLLILEIMEMGPNRGKLFLAFADETSARETYGGGRYLDLKKVPAATTLELDFNKAYNPYCAYNEAYSCPLPPKENVLPLAIRAGEKSFK